MHDGKILLIKRTKPDVVYWVIPGGGVEKGETEEQAIIRECKEELGVDIKVKELFLEIDSKKPEIKGQKEYFYLCEVIDGKVGVGKGPEFQKDSGYFGPQNGGEEQGSCRRQGSYFERSEKQGSARRAGSYSERSEKQGSAEGKVLISSEARNKVLAEGKVLMSANIKLSGEKLTT